MAIISILAILTVIVYLGVKFFSKIKTRAIFIGSLISIFLIPTLLPLNPVTSLFKLPASIAFAEGNLAYVSFLHDEHSEIKNREVKMDILNKVNYCQKNLSNEIFNINKIDDKLPVHSIYLSGYIKYINVISDNLEQRQKILRDNERV